MTDYLTIKLLAPEIILVGVATLVYLAGAFVRPGFRPLGFALLGLAASAIALFATRDLIADAMSSASPAVLSGPLVIDLYANIVRWGILSAGVLLVLLADPPASERQSAEYTGSLLLIVAGLMLASVANDLVLLFAALELVSIPTYVVLYVGKRGPSAQEATAKYFFLSVLSSAALLYGFSFLYGLGGSTRLDAIAAAFAGRSATNGSVGPFALVALVLIVAGLGFRLAAVPFHFYAPDVFQGTSHANAGMLSTLPKVAGLIVLVRLLVDAMPGIEPIAWKVVMAVSVLTMTLGNVVALWQSNVRRLMAYSSIAHAGYILIGVAVGLAQQAIGSSTSQQTNGVNGVGTALFYLAVYGLASLGTFAALAYLSSRGREVDDVDALAGLSQTHPFVAASLAVFMFSLAGIPPMAGFWGKFALFSGTIDLGAPVGQIGGDMQPWFLGLAIVGVVNAAIAAAYYLRVVATMYFRSPASARDPVNADAPPAMVHHQPEPALAMAIALALVIAAGIFPGRMMELSDDAGTSVSSTSPPDALEASPVALQAAADGN